MSTTKFLFLYRGPAEQPKWEPSPDQMQAMLEAWNAWKARFSQEVIDVGDGLKPTGAVYKDGTVTDGPFIEGKEVMGGYSIVAVSSLERAIEIARECPIKLQPGASVEIRELAGY